jgi:hypothetical protein
MIRPRAGGFVYSRAELDRMRDDIAVAIELGAAESCSAHWTPRRSSTQTPRAS